MGDYSYTTAASVQSELRTTTEFSSSTVPTLDTINQWIQDASDYINQIAGRVYGSTSYTETFDYWGQETLTLKNAPIIAITSVLYSTAALDSTSYGLTATKTEGTHYTVYDDEGEIDILFNNWQPYQGRKRIQVNYTAGYSTIPGTVGMLATKIAARRVLDSLMTKDVNEKKSGKSVSVGSISIVKPADYGVSQYKTLKEDIAQLENDIINGSSLYRLPLTRHKPTTWE